MNPHTRRRQILNLVRLPIPPLPHVGSILSGIGVKFIIGSGDQIGPIQADYLDTNSLGSVSSPADLRKPLPPVVARTTMNSAEPTRTIIVPEGTSA